MQEQRPTQWHHLPTYQQISEQTQSWFRPQTWYFFVHHFGTTLTCFEQWTENRKNPVGLDGIGDLLNGHRRLTRKSVPNPARQVRDGKLTKQRVRTDATVPGQVSSAGKRELSWWEMRRVPPAVKCASQAHSAFKPTHERTKASPTSLEIATLNNELKKRIRSCLLDLRPLRFLEKPRLQLL